MLAYYAHTGTVGVHTVGHSLVVAQMAGRSIRTLKDHSIAILASIEDASLKCLWNPHLEHAELTLNIFQQATINPHR